MPAQNDFTIGQLAQRAELATETLRHYERLGLIEPSRRSPSNYRVYDARALRRLRFIRRAQALGFSLPEIRQLLDLHRQGEGDMAQVRGIAEQRLRQIEQRMADLQRLRAGLEQLIEACPGHGALGECPILGALCSEEDPT
jgi:DNA-binding transcriptional MerR regulator